MSNGNPLRPMERRQHQAVIWPKIFPFFFYKPKPQYFRVVGPYGNEYAEEVGSGLTAFSEAMWKNCRGNTLDWQLWNMAFEQSGLEWNRISHWHNMMSTYIFRLPCIVSFSEGQFLLSGAFVFQHPYPSYLIRFKYLFINNRSSTSTLRYKYPLGYS
jgi:hypothetical protein